MLTGESLTVAKQSGVAAVGQGPFDLPSCAFMGTVVAHGTAKAVVVTTVPMNAQDGLSLIHI